MVSRQPRIGSKIDVGKGSAVAAVAAVAARREEYPGKCLDYLALFVVGSSGG